MEPARPLEERRGVALGWQGCRREDESEDEESHWSVGRLVGWDGQDARPYAFTPFWRVNSTNPSMLQTARIIHSSGILLPALT